MSAIPVIAIFDVGKTNKKLFLFDKDYHVLYEKSARFEETIDDDGDSCENIESLRGFLFESMREVLINRGFDIKTINFSAYGASLVHIDEKGEPITALYNYLKPYPQDLKEQFYNMYGGEETFSYQTASPVLGHLNSGMQLYWLKYKKPQLFQAIKYSLHLPQYLSFLFTGKAYSDITSIGCHTNLWDFTKNRYHAWVSSEGVIEKLAPIVSGESVMPVLFQGESLHVGVGLHDSSAALIPYLVHCKEPFILISTGTWCISLNPFNHQPLTPEELDLDCLSYLTYEGKPVKASRLFAGNEHEQQVKRIADFFNRDRSFYESVAFDDEIIVALQQNKVPADRQADNKTLIQESLFGKRDLSKFKNISEAYHQLISDIIIQQQVSTQLVLKGTGVKSIFVDGGFSKNNIYMNLLASAFPDLQIFAASMAQATAVGTALSIHKSWNSKAMPTDIIELRNFSSNNRY